MISMRLYYSLAIVTIPLLSLASEALVSQQEQLRELATITAKASKQIHPDIAAKVRQPGAYLVGQIVTSTQVIVHPASQTFTTFPKAWVVTKPSKQDPLLFGWSAIRPDFKQISATEFFQIPEVRSRFLVLAPHASPAMVDEARKIAHDNDQGLIAPSSP